MGFIFTHGTAIDFSINNSWGCVFFCTHRNYYAISTYGNSMTSVIVIDDDHDGADALSQCLIMKGIDVLAKGFNGLEAIQLYQKFKPGFVLLDIVMPYYDGFYGLSKILEFDRNAKVIIVSASCTRDDEEKLIELGALDIVT